MMHDERETCRRNECDRASKMSLKRVHESLEGCDVINVS